MHNLFTKIVSKMMFSIIRLQTPIMCIYELLLQLIICDRLKYEYNNLSTIILWTIRRRGYNIALYWLK